MESLCGKVGPITGNTLWDHPMTGFCTRCWNLHERFDPNFCYLRLDLLFTWFVPTCQVRVVRFYQSCSPPPPPPPPSPPPPQFLLDHVLPTLRQALRQLPSSVRTAGLQPGTFPAQRAPLDLNLGPSQLSAHCWTSTWDLPSSARTAGPQPGTFPAQCAPLDFNLGPSQLSAHRWTSTAR